MVEPADVNESLVLSNCFRKQPPSSNAPVIMDTKTLSTRRRVTGSSEGVPA